MKSLFKKMIKSTHFVIKIVWKIYQQNQITHQKLPSSYKHILLTLYIPKKSINFLTLD